MGVPPVIKLFKKVSEQRSSAVTHAVFPHRHLLKGISLTIAEVASEGDSPSNYFDRRFRGVQRTPRISTKGAQS
jgi:hypothetical protein